MTDIYLTIKPKKQNVAHKWKTNVMRAVTGKEQRSALFSFPRMELDLQFKRGGNPETNWLRRRLLFDAGKIWGIPIWHDEMSLTANANAPAAYLQVNSVEERHLYVGRKVMLLDKADWSDYEVGEISSLATGQINLDSSLTGSWNKTTTRVLPVFDFRLGASTSLRRRSSKMDMLSLSVKEDVTGTLLDYAYTTPTTSMATYQGHPLLVEDVQDAKQWAIDHPYQGFGGIGRNMIESYYADADSHINTEITFLKEGRTNIWKLFELFDSRMGMLSPFWVPTWAKDLVPSAAIGSSDTVINIDSSEYFNIFLSNTMINRHLFIGLPDRTYACRKITDASVSTITLDSAIGADIRLSQLSRVLMSFLVFSRFSSDRMEAQYKRGSLAEVRLRTIGLVQETP